MQAAQLFEGVVQMCQNELASDSYAQKSLADEYSLTCVGGVEEANDCLPVCDEQQHGKKLLANINGEDSSYTCELHHGLCALLPTSCCRCCLCADGCVRRTGTPGSGAAPAASSRATSRPSSLPSSRAPPASSGSSWTRTTPAWW